MKPVTYDSLFYQIPLCLKTFVIFTDTPMYTVQYAMMSKISVIGE